MKPLLGSARFENMKKEQEEEAAKRVAEERSKRTVNEQQAQQKQPPTSNGHEKAKQQDVAPVAKEPVRAPQPEPALPQVSSPDIYENMGQKFETQRSIPVEKKQEEPVKSVGGINVSSLLRQRKPSSSSSCFDDDDQWADDRHSHTQPQSETNHRTPSPTPVVHSPPSSNTDHNEGVKCMARYSYQKSKPFLLLQCQYSPACVNISS